MSGETGSARQSAADRIPPRIPPWTWAAHLAIVLAAAGIMVVASKHGGRSALATISVGVGAVLAILFGAQAVIARRADRARMAIVAYLLMTAGTVAMVWSRAVHSIDAAGALGGVAIVSFVAATVLLGLEHRRKRHTS